MPSWISRAAAVLGLLTLASNAHAGPVTYSGYEVLNNEGVRLTDAKEGFDEYGGSGRITLLNSDTDHGRLDTWCVDIPDWLLWSGTFRSSHTVTGPVGDTINALLTNGVPILGGDHDASSALQIAIWKAVYGPDLHVSEAGRNLSLADAFLHKVSTGAWPPDRNMEVTVLSGGGLNQDQAFLTHVPEPASIALLGTSLLAFGLVRRRVRLSRTS